MGKSKIEWTDETWNPITGCTKISPACDNCYAESLHGQRHKAFHEGKRVPECYAEPFGKIRFFPERLERPLHWNKPRRVFVVSMGDLFHNDVTDRWIDQVVGVMAATPHITYQVLTKRPERLHEYFTGHCRDAEIQGTRDEILESLPTNSRRLLNFTRWSQEEDHGGVPTETLSGWEPDIKWPLPNVWLGVTAENQEMADYRIPILLDTPAAVRFVSVEPMLGPVKITEHLFREPLGMIPFVEGQTFGGEFGPALDWVICGGETGPGARYLEVGWAEWLQGQCEEAGVPFFFKKWGSAWGGMGRDGYVRGKFCREFPTTHGG